MLDVSIFSNARSSAHDSAVSGQVRFYGLPAGATGTAIFAAMRNTRATDRKAEITHSGTTVTLDAATTAASNQASLPFTVAGDGTLAFDIANAAGSNHGYLGACILDFD